MLTVQVFVADESAGFGVDQFNSGRSVGIFTRQSVECGSDLVDEKQILVQPVFPVAQQVSPWDPVLQGVLVDYPPTKKEYRHCMNIIEQEHRLLYSLF